MKAMGRHILLELSQCNPEVLRSLEKVKEFMVEAARQARAQVLRATFHKFSPQGISGVVVIAESHLSIHTWPEEGYAAADIYTCGDTTDPERACEFLARAFEARHMKATTVHRGFKNHNGAFSHRVFSSPQVMSPDKILEDSSRPHAALKSA